MRYLLSAVLILSVIGSCGGDDYWITGKGGSGQTVQFEIGCGDRAVQCQGGLKRRYENPSPDYGELFCDWECAVWVKGETPTGAYRGEDPAGYVVSFRQKDDGCWEVAAVSRLWPRC